VSGTRVQVEKTMEGLSGLADWQDIARAMIDANLRMNSTWMRLLRSMTKKQQFELDSNGFTFTQPKQFKDFVFADDGTKNIHLFRHLVTIYLSTLRSL
jgi:hypothetical protein